MGSRCVVYKCRAEAAGLLCWRHLHELDVEAGARGCQRQEVGSQSGHGAFGVLDRTESGVLCHECGERFASLGHHVRRSHQLDPDKYRYTHGLDPKESLLMPRREDGLPRRRAHPCRRCGVDVTTRAKLCPGCKVQRAEALAKEATRGGLSGVTRLRPRNVPSRTLNPRTCQAWLLRCRVTVCRRLP